MRKLIVTCWSSVGYSAGSSARSFPFSRRNQDWRSQEHTAIGSDNCIFITCIKVTATLCTFIYSVSVFLDYLLKWESCLDLPYMVRAAREFFSYVVQAFYFIGQKSRKVEYLTPLTRLVSGVFVYPGSWSVLFSWLSFIQPASSIFSNKDLQA